MAPGQAVCVTIVDDTDQSTVENVGPVYEFLSEFGLRTTKRIWPIAPLGPPRTGGQSLEDPDYRRWVLELKDQGFEIALHGASDETSTRERVLRRAQLLPGGHRPGPTPARQPHGQVESIYWGRRGSTACRRSSTSGPGGSPRARINSTGIAGSPYFRGGSVPRPDHVRQEPGLPRDQHPEGKPTDAVSRPMADLCEVLVQLQ